MRNERRGGKIIVIVGPTVVGKSALAVELAKKFNGEIISADSRQVYRGLDIGTGKITMEEMRGVKHHLLDVASPRGQYSVVRYVKAAQRVFEDITGRGKLPIVVGGTGLYIDALLGKVAIPEVPPNSALRARLSKKTAAELFTILRKLDPRRANAIDRRNPRRLIRAIEISQNLGSIPAQHSYIPRNVGMLQKQFNPKWIGLTLPPETLREKIAMRLFARIRKGMIAEVKNLRKDGLSWKRLDALGLEYRYISRYLRGLLTKQEMIEKLQTEIWRYAKRQSVWFKRNREISWFKPHQTLRIAQTSQKFLT